MWGGLHGFGIVILQLWRKIGITLPKVVAWFVTFLFVVVAWVFFRAESFVEALRILYGMVGLNGFNFSALNPTLAPLTSALEISQTAARAIGTIELFVFLAFLIAVVVFLPNSQTLAKRFRPTVPSLAFLIALALIALFSMNSVSEFIYFQF